MWRYHFMKILACSTIDLCYILTFVALNYSNTAYYETKTYSVDHLCNRDFSRMVIFSFFPY